MRLRDDVARIIGADSGRDRSDTVGTPPAVSRSPWPSPLRLPSTKPRKQPIPYERPADETF